MSNNGGKSVDGADGTYKVGKCKPPIETQFKKGNKAGKGRPKGAKNFKTIVNQVLGSKIRAKVDGKLVSLSNKEFIVMQLAKQARAGEFKAIDRVISLEARYGPQEDPDGPAPEEIERDIAGLRDFLNRHDLLTGAKVPDDE